MVSPLLLRIVILSAEAFHQGGDVFGPPDGGARAEFYGFGVTAGPASFPPRAFADGEDGKNLGQTEKSIGGDDGELLL